MEGGVMYKVIMILTVVCFFSACGGAETVKLPAPKIKGKVSVEEAIYARRSIRRFENVSLTLEEVSQILWSAGGKTVDGLTGPTRSYPSAGGIYPLEIYLVAGSVNKLKPGIYRYDWRNNSLTSVREGDLRKDLSGAALGQGMVAAAPITVAVTVVTGKAERRYGARATSRYVPMDAGHIGQNVHLQAHALGLGTVMVGAFRDDAVAKVLGITSDEEPLYMMPVGKPKK